MRITNDPNIKKIVQDQNDKRGIERRRNVKEGSFKEILKGQASDAEVKTKATPEKTNVSDLNSARPLGLNLDSEVTKSKILAKSMVNKVKQVPDPERQARIETIKNQLANGQYNVTAEELADKMLSDGVIDRLLSS